MRAEGEASFARWPWSRPCEGVSARRGAADSAQARKGVAGAKASQELWIRPMEHCDVTRRVKWCGLQMVGGRWRGSGGIYEGGERLGVAGVWSRYGAPHRGASGAVGEA